ncbi:hypothetical protein MACJ_001865 [Theileria orientalis]|uniref:CAAX prenyl protease 2/Lysostaphin resistance protein A-like domain-containing protein n=1 Tax=Theileria orientalis TaxID=68886 RepID=A0A976M568_THEOR|nr:hypothetical protein MACJ_001865 [Theileria orientalis]
MDLNLQRMTHLHISTLPNEATNLGERNLLFKELFGPYVESYKLISSSVKSNVLKFKRLVPTSSADLRLRVCRLVERAKLCNTYKIALTNYHKLKQRMANMSVVEQFSLLLVANALYVFVLPKYHIVFPFQLFPSDSGLGTEIGLDTLVSIPFMYYFLKDLKIDGGRFRLTNASPFKISMVVSSLVASFFLSSYFASIMDSLVLFISALNFPVSLEMLNAVSIISGHLFWMAIGSTVLHKYMFPLFGGENAWYKLDVKKTWVYQVLSGYFSSCLVYKIVDNLFLSIVKNFNLQKCESPTDQTISNVCESNETLPIIITSIAPCLTAPWWEELLYRVFTFKIFNSFLPSLASSLISSVLFSLNHLSMGSFFQLFSLGLLWSLIHNKEDNIFVTFLIHCLWNSRIFLGSLTGL